MEQATKRKLTEIVSDYEKEGFLVGYCKTHETYCYSAQEKINDPQGWLWIANAEDVEKDVDVPTIETFYNVIF